MILTIQLVGDLKLIARLQNMPSAVHVALIAKVNVLRFRLQNYIVTSKLNGQVLNRKTGRLARSIQSRIASTLNTVMGIVYSAGDVKYARIHEYGGRTPAHVILPKKAKALAFYWDKVGENVVLPYVNHPGSLMPQRSYMRSGLRDLSVEISTGIKAAVAEGLRS